MPGQPVVSQSPTLWSEYGTVWLSWNRNTRQKLFCSSRTASLQRSSARWPKGEFLDFYDWQLSNGNMLVLESFEIPMLDSDILRGTLPLV